MEEYTPYTYIVNDGRPDREATLLRGYGASAINQYLSDTTLTDAERSNLQQLGSSLKKLNRNQGLYYVTNDVEFHSMSNSYTPLGHVDAISNAYIKFWDPEAEEPNDSLLIRVKNPDTIYEPDISLAFRHTTLDPEMRVAKLRSIFWQHERRDIKPSIEIALVKKDDKSINKHAARIRWEWDCWNGEHGKVVTRGFVQGDTIGSRGRVQGRNDIIPDKIPGIRNQDIPIVTFINMRSAVIWQAAS